MSGFAQGNVSYYQKNLNLAIKQEQFNQTTKKKESLMDAAEGYASLFYKNFLKDAYKAQDGLFSGGYIEAQLHEMLVDQYASIMSKAENSALTMKLYDGLKSKYGDSV